MMTLRAIKHIRLGEAPGQAFDDIVLEAHDRHLRRKLITTTAGLEVLIDLEKPVFIEDGDHLALEDGRHVEVNAAEEELLEVTGVSPAHMVSLGRHIGNRHLAAQLEWNRILIKPDAVIRDMLLRLGAKVSLVREQFEPEHGAYHIHDH